MKNVHGKNAHYVAKSMWPSEHDIHMGLFPLDVWNLAAASRALGGKVWLIVSAAVHFKGVGWGWGQDSKPNWENIFL